MIIKTDKMAKVLQKKNKEHNSVLSCDMVADSKRIMQLILFHKYFTVCLTNRIAFQSKLPFINHSCFFLKKIQEIHMGIRLSWIEMFPSRRLCYHILIFENE